MDMILTEIGEIGVHTGAVTYVLRPSLFAMSQLGSPAQIVDLFATVMADVELPRLQMAQLQDAVSVLNVCAGEGDVSGLFGYWEEGDQALEYRPGIVPKEDCLALARCLLRHGVIGAIPAELPRPGKEPEYLREFNARDMAALAMAHLGLNEREAWGMTMTALVAALKSKFPPAESNEPGARAPSKEEHEQTMEWFERIEAKRRKRALH